VIQLCPIDTRRKLYNNIALSGGSTLFRGFKDRLERRVTERVHDRLRKYEMKSGTKVALNIFSQLPLTSRSWIILISGMRFGWEGHSWQVSQVLAKCTILVSNIKK
jgi:actin-related protein